MRLVFVNHAHPELPHVSGMRTGYFAKELALRGHQVVLLTCSLPGAANRDGDGQPLSTRLVNHDWRQPLLIAVSPVRRRALELIRENRLPSVLRRALTLREFIVHGGVFADWHAATESAATQLAQKFRPEAVWATFGNTTNLAIGQQLARRAMCPWVMDVKDNWEAFIPSALRRLMAWRFRDVVAWTSNSKFHQQSALRWFRRRPTYVIYSGVADAFYESAPEVRAASKCRILLIGSTYDAARLKRYLQAVRDWLEGVPVAARDHMVLTYAGSDSKQVAAITKEVMLPCAVEILSQQEIEILARLAKSSFVNCYIAGPHTYHHKLMELLVCGRPIVSYPEEREESKELASKTDTVFNSCATNVELQEALNAAWARRSSVGLSTTLPPWRWADFAAQLEGVLESLSEAP